MTKFEEAVARWLEGEDKPVKVVHSVDAYGTDWRGSTEDGFSSAFDVTIYYETSDGITRRELVEGDELARFWRFMMDAAFADAATATEPN